jgi:REP element-mobilizing transposase RayT
MGHPGQRIFWWVLGEVRDGYGFLPAGYVVMPEHVHPLISEPAKGTPSRIMQVLKQRVSRRLRRKTLTPTRQLGLGFQTSDHLLPTFWEPRFYDFNVWSQKKFVEKLQYMRMNPVKRKLVVHPKDWPWSTSRAAARRRKFSLLRETRFGVDPYRCHELIRSQGSPQKPQPSKTEDWGTQNSKSKSGPPAASVAGKNSTLFIHRQNGRACRDRVVARSEWCQSEKAPLLRTAQKWATPVKESFGGFWARCATVTDFCWPDML